MSPFLVVTVSEVGALPLLPAATIREKLSISVAKVVPPCAGALGLPLTTFSCSPSRHRRSLAVRVIPWTTPSCAHVRLQRVTLDIPERFQPTPITPSGL